MRCIVVVLVVLLVIQTLRMRKYRQQWGINRLHKILKDPVTTLPAEFVPPQNIRIGKSKLHGNGVFATRKFVKGDIIEKLPVLKLKNANVEQYGLRRYLFTVHSNASMLALGYGSIYNHSFKPNAHLVVDHDDSNANSGVMFATETIENGEEILINYGKGYWEFWGEIDEALKTTT